MYNLYEYYKKKNVGVGYPATVTILQKYRIPTIHRIQENHINVCVPFCKKNTCRKIEERLKS